MKTIYRCLAVVAGLVFCGMAHAQNLDPTVVVDRAYEGKLMEVHKPALEMAVPDSVMRFDLDFDYSVFDSPYKGSYEFNPYLLSMKPSSVTDEAGRLYLRAGAGYQLRPELDFVWSPKLKSNQFRLDVYADHRSYVGDYLDLDFVKIGSGIYDPSAPAYLEPGRTSWKGYDLKTDAGVAMSYDWAKGKIGLDMGYYGLHQKDLNWTRGYNAVDASFDVSSKVANIYDFLYDLSADYRYASDNSTNNSDESRQIGEHNLDVDFQMRKHIKGGSAFRAGAGLAFAGYTGYVENAAADLNITAGYVYQKGILHADLGVRISNYIVDTTVAGFDVPAANQYVYPDVNVRVNVFPKFMSVFASAAGGPKVKSYSSILEGNHHAELSVPGVVVYQAGKNNIYGYKMGIEVERVSLAAGLEGRIGSNFSYSLFGEYTDYASGMLDAAVYYVTTSSSFCSVVPGVEYLPYKKASASFNWGWNSDSFASYGNVTYTAAFGDVLDKSWNAFRPAALTGEVSFVYNYKKRIFGGVTCDFSTSRVTGDPLLAIPGYADLGVILEYVTVRNLSFWAKGGNLLGMNIQRNPAYIVDDPYFTLGICLNL